MNNKLISQSLASDLKRKCMLLSNWNGLSWYYDYGPTISSYGGITILYHIIVW